jgi:hypothetical protein
MEEFKALNGVTVKQDAKAVEVSWMVSVIRDDGSIAASTPFNRAYGQFDREQFLLDMADEPTAVTYADLAGLEVRPVVIEPATTEPEPITE